MAELEDGPGSDRLGDLLVRSGQGDRGAFALLYDTTVAALFTIVVHHLRDRSWAEHVLQHAYLALWRSAPAFPVGAPAARWILVYVDRAIASAETDPPRPSRPHGLITDQERGDAGEEDSSVGHTSMGGSSG